MSYEIIYYQMGSVKRLNCRFTIYFVILRQISCRKNRVIFNV